MIEFIKKQLYGTILEKQARQLGGLYHYLKYPKIRMGRKYDTQTVLALKKHLKVNSNCIDIGCHQGILLKEMIKYAPGGKHFAFEPIPHLYENLLQKFPNTSVYPIALSNTKGQASFFHIINNPAYSGLAKRSPNANTSEIVEIKVEVDRLDSIIPVNHSVDFIKIDTEGAELNVLNGAVETLERNNPLVVFEFEKEAAEKYGATPENLFDLLSTRLNMNISLLEYWHKNEKPLSKDQLAEQFYKEKNFYFIAYKK